MHTFVTLEVPWTCFEHVRQQLVDAGYAHAILTEGGQLCLDMHGIALVSHAPGETREPRGVEELSSKGVAFPYGQMEPRGDT